MALPPELAAIVVQLKERYKSKATLLAMHSENGGFYIDTLATEAFASMDYLRSLKLVYNTWKIDPVTRQARDVVWLLPKAEVILDEHKNEWADELWKLEEEEGEAEVVTHSQYLKQQKKQQDYYRENTMKDAPKQTTMDFSLTLPVGKEPIKVVDKEPEPVEVAPTPEDTKPVTLPPLDLEVICDKIDEGVEDVKTDSDNIEQQ